MFSASSVSVGIMFPNHLGGKASSVERQQGQACSSRIAPHFSVLMSVFVCVEEYHQNTENYRTRMVK